MPKEPGSGEEGTTVLVQGSFRIDPTARPRTIDVIITQGAARGQVLQGIYDRDGDTLRVCLAARAGPRPSEMSSKPDSGQTLMVHKAAKKAPGSP
jgi:uncharacterized protein (TIGR03067 family)